MTRAISRQAEEASSTRKAIQVVIAWLASHFAARIKNFIRGLSSAISMRPVLNMDRQRWRQQRTEHHSNQQCPLHLCKARNDSTCTCSPPSCHTTFQTGLLLLLILFTILNDPLIVDKLRYKNLIQAQKDQLTLPTSSSVKDHASHSPPCIGCYNYAFF